MRRTIHLLAALLTIPAIAAEPPAKVHTDRHGDPLPPGALGRLGTVRLRHQGRAFAFSPDGKQIASACSDGCVRIWDAATGQERSRLDGFHYPGRMAYSPDGKILAVNDFEDCTVVHLWDMMTGKRVRKLSGRKLQCPTDIPAPAFSPDGKLLAAGEYNTGISLWNTATGDRVRRLDKCKGEHDAITFRADGKQLLVTSRDGVVELWDLHGRQLRKFDTGYGNTCSPVVAADGKTLVLGAASEKEDAGWLSVWDIVSGKERRRLKVPGEVGGIALAPDGKTLAYSSPDAAIHLQDMDSWKEVRRIDVSEGDALNLAFSPDSKTLAACVEGSLQLWDTATGRPLAARPGHITAVDRVVFTANGRQLISIARDQALGTARVWDALTGQFLHMLPEEWNWTDGGVLCASRDGNLLLLGDVNAITVWDAAKHRRIRQVPLETKRAGKMTHVLLALALSPDGQRMTSLHEPGDLTSATLQVWDVASGKRLSRRTFDLHERAVHPPVFSPDGRLLAATDGQVIWLRDAVSGAVRQTIAMKDPAAEEKLRGRLVFSNDGRLLACFSHSGEGVIEDAASTSGKVRVWEMPTGTELPPLAAPWTQAIAFAPDGRTLATAGGTINDDLNTFEKPIRLWDIVTGKEIAHFEGHGALVGSLCIAAENYPLAFSPDGQKLATGLMDSTVLLWDLKPALQRFTESRPAVRSENLPHLWADLAGLDARKAQASLFALAMAPELALPFLEPRLKPANPADAEQLRRLIANLDSEQFAVRKAASEQLRRLDRLAEPALRKALEGKPSLESRRRIKDLLASSRGPAVSAEMRRTVRAVAALEHMNCDRSRRLLAKLAEGAAESHLTEEARAALDRLPQR